MNKLLENKPRRTVFLGNEAIVRGALEAGVDFVSTYPGTPASEIGDIFSEIQNSKFKIQNLYFEYSSNEKVAFEAAAGAAFFGLKSLVAMKHFGLNVAADALGPAVYTGIEGAMVVVVADDPGCWSSAQTEQDTRYFVKLFHLPLLEPSDPQECKDFTKLAFKISEKFKIPVILRTTTRVAHQQGIVRLSKTQNPKSKTRKVIERGRFSTMPPNVLRLKKELFEKLEKIRQFSERISINRIEDPNPGAKLGIIASGISYLYAKEACQKLKAKIPILKIGFSYPLSKNLIKKFIKNLKRVLIIEELEPFLEEEIKAIAKDINPRLEFFGNELPKIGELKPEYVIELLSNILDKKLKFNFKVHQPNFQKLNLITRFPNLCPGCPYWGVVSAVKKAAPKNTIIGGDIGCYMVFGCPPYNLQDWLISMGSSIGIAHGVKKTIKEKVITFIGDSTFFHAGIPALINTVFNKSNPLIIVLDNGTTGMTGHQPHPGVGKTGQGEETLAIKIEDIVSACGVKHWKVIDPTNQEEFVKTIKEFLEKKEVSVIIARRPCVFLTRH